MERSDLITFSDLEGWKVEVYGENVWVEHTCGFVVNAKADTTLENLVSLAVEEGEHDCMPVKDSL